MKHFKNIDIENKINSNLSELKLNIKKGNYIIDYENIAKKIIIESLKTN